MKIKILGKILKDKISLFSSLIKGRSKDMVSGQIRFVVKEEYLAVQYTNSSLSFTTKIYDVLCSGNKSFLADADIIWKFIKNHPEELEIEVADDKTLIFNYLNGSFSTFWFDDSSYPSFFKMPDNIVKVSSGYFVPVLKRAFSFLDKSEFTDFLNRIFLNIKEKEIDVVSTDRFKLFKSTKEFSESMNPTSFKISSDLAGIVYLYVKDEDCEIDIADDDRRVFVKIQDILISELNTEERYPNYQRLFDIHQSFSSVKVNKSCFLKSIDRVSALSDETFLNVVLDNTVTVILKNSLDSGYAKEDVPSLEYNNNSVEIRLKKNDLINAVKAIVGDEVVISYSDNTKNILLYNPKYLNEKIICSTFVN